MQDQGTEVKSSYNGFNRIAAKATKQLMDKVQRQVFQESRITNFNDRVSSAINFKEKSELIGKIDFTDFGKSNFECERKLIVKLIEINKYLSTKKGFFDRAWSGYESLEEIVDHIKKVSTKIFNHEPHILIDDNLDLRFLNIYPVNYSQQGSHLALMDILNIKNEHPDLFKFIYEALSYIKNKFYIESADVNYAFTMALESIAESVYGEDSDEVQERFGDDVKVLKSLTNSYKNGSVSKHFKKLSSFKTNEKRIIKNSLKVSGFSKNVDKLIKLTKVLIDDKSGNNVSSFHDWADENSEYLGYAEGISIYWQDDHVTSEAFDYMNSRANECGVNTPVIIHELEESNSKPPNTDLIKNIQKWISTLNEILYGKN